MTTVSMQQCVMPILVSPELMAACKVIEAQLLPLDKG